MDTFCDSRVRPAGPMFVSLAAWLLMLLMLPSPAWSHDADEPDQICRPESGRDPTHSAARCAFRNEIERLKTIQRRHEDRILAAPRVLGMGIGKAEGELRAVFVIFVDAGWPPPRLPQRIEGVDVRVEQRRPVRVLDGAPGCSPCHRDQFPPPVRMGNSAGLNAINGGCTMGFKACDLSSGLMVFVTNSHCNIVTPAPVCALVTPGGIVDEWVHPGPFEQMGDPYLVGNVAGHAAPSCSGNNNLVDASKVTSANTLTSLAARDMPFYPGITPGDPLPGDTVQKSGRTTGYTSGDVTAINVTVEVPADGGFCCGALTMKQQVEWLPSDGTLPGDSGSGVLSLEAPPRVVGLLWGGDGTFAYANHIDNVLSALNISLNPTACLADCLYARAAKSLPEPGAGTPYSVLTPSGLIDLGHRYRDQVLRRSLVGQQFVGHFYQFSDEAIALATRSPGLLMQTARTLLTIAPSVAAVVESGRAQVPAAHLDLVDALLAAYQTDASGELQQAIRETREQLKLPKTLRAIGIRLER